jgi:hypothetical protein
MSGECNREIQAGAIMPGSAGQETLPMSSPETEQSVQDVPAGDSAHTAGVAPSSNKVSEAPSTPSVTFQGNTYDLMALGSLVVGGLVLFSCLTCNTGIYCLPLVPIALGTIGLIGARQSVQADRTRLWSWLGIAAGVMILLLIVLAMVLYIGFIALAIITQPS